MTGFPAQRPLSELLNQIRQSQISFSAAQRRVAEYVLENYTQIPFLSISALAENVGVSSNSVIKFCNQLGYAKFAEFKKAFSACARTELVMFNKISETAGTGNRNDPFVQGTEDDVAAIQATLSDPGNREKLPVLLSMIDNASHIYITGGRSSGALASFFATALRYLDLKVHDVSAGVGDYRDRMAMVTENDLVIAISLPRYTAEVVHVLQQLHTRGIPIALITDTGLSPAHPFADVALHCAVNSSYYHLCCAGCMSLISVICRAAAAHRKQDAAKHMRQLESELLNNGIFL